MTSQRAAAVLLGEVARVMKAFDPHQPRDAEEAPPLKHKHRRVKKFLQAVNTVLKFDERKHRRDAEGQFAPKHGPADASGSSAASTAKAARAADKASLFAVQSHSAEAHHLAARAHAHAASLFGAGDAGRKFHLDAQQSHTRMATLLGGGASAASTPPVVKPSAAPPSRSPRPPLAKPALTPAQAVQAATEASARAAARATPGAHQLAGHAHKVAAKLFGAGTPEWKKHTEAREQHRLRAQELLSQGKAS